jgi:hypothetical protein
MVNFGGPDEAKWIGFHQLGNWRDHDNYWYLTEIYRARDPLPGVNGEPYYPGFPDNIPSADSVEADLNCRSGLYGGFLSGGFAGYLYGAEGLWGGDNSPAATYRMWEALHFSSGAQVPYVLAFADGAGLRSYGELVPDDGMITPNRSGGTLGYRGWAYCARTADRKTLLCFFEKGCPRAAIRGVEPGAAFTLTWFDPENGEWSDTDIETFADGVGRIVLPEFPRKDDNGLRVIYAGQH